MHPRAVILVLIDEPSTSSYGGVVAAPVFRHIASGVMQALRVRRARASRRRTARACSRPRRRHGQRPPGQAGTRAAGAAAPAAGASRRGAAADADGAPGTPSYLGLSLREALTRAHAAGWDVDVDGTGYVAEQQPRPGHAAGGDDRLASRSSYVRIAASAQP